MTKIKLKFIHEYNRRGKPYYYFRRRGFKQVRLPGLPGSDEFMAAYQEALSSSQPKEIGANRTKPGTVNAAIVGYYQCLAFRELALGTQLTRRHIHKGVATLEPKHIQRMIDRLRSAHARNWLKALRHLLDFAVAEGFRKDNPARDVKLPKIIQTTSGMDPRRNLTM
jgi:hypothetical protein